MGVCWYRDICQHHYSNAIISAMASQITRVSIFAQPFAHRQIKEKTSELGVSGICEGNPPETGGFPSQSASNAENVCFWWHHHDVGVPGFPPISRWDHGPHLNIKCRIANIWILIIKARRQNTHTRKDRLYIATGSALQRLTNMTTVHAFSHLAMFESVIARRAGLLWSQQDFEWRWSVPLFKCLTVLEFSFILFDLCLLITFYNFIMNYVPIVTFWIFTYHKIWILSIMFCSIWSYWIIYFLACLEVSWRVVS